MRTVTRKQFIRYTVLPGLRPRIQGLFFSGFQHIPFFIALVYHAVKLLPANHPYVNPANIGKFGIRHVIAEAANNLVLKKQNIDQIILFAVVLVGLVIVFSQVVLLTITLFSSAALAAGGDLPTNFKEFFITEKPQQDLAMMLLDMVFGVPGLFNSCVSTGGGCLDVANKPIVDASNTWILAPLGWPFPIHIALHAMFRIYSLGLLVVAALITCYFIAAIALETAQTGTPFGKRFNKLWAPIRIVVAFGLLIPLGSPGDGKAGTGGLNSSQYIVLYAAKYGSGFASNGWRIFNEVLIDTYKSNTVTADKGAGENLVSTPKAPEIGGLLQFMFVAATCNWLEYARTDGASWISPYVVKDILADPPYNLLAEIGYDDSNGVPQAPKVIPYNEIMNFVKGQKSIVIRFGPKPDIKKYPKEKGHTPATCGELIIPLADPRMPGKAMKGTEAMQRYYVYIVQELWNDIMTGEPPAGYPEFADLVDKDYPSMMVDSWAGYKKVNDPPVKIFAPPNSYRTNLQSFYNKDIKAALTDPNSTGLSGIIGTSKGAVAEQSASADFMVSDALRDKGWAGAGLWYNKIAEMNGAVTESVLGIPTVSRWPEVMEYVRDKKRQQDKNVGVADRFKPWLSNGKGIPYTQPYWADYAPVLSASFDYWQKGFTASPHTEPTSNIFMDTINALLGTSGLFSMRENTDVHPLAQLTGIGRSLVESAVRNLTFATGGGASAAVFSSFDFFAGKMTAVVSSALISIVMITLSAGFILYYIVPFLPFIYFFFAVGGWLKAIFEAMVGAPLWALAHIRIDGNGLPGSAAINGYLLIFEIFLRPILMVFGLLASISIFAALVAALNDMWTLVTSNLTGFDVTTDAAATKSGKGVALTPMFRGALDEFFFTIIYAIIVYMMALSSFKIIDLIPANILRWMGQSVATENDAKENAAESLITHSATGGQQGISTVGGSLKEAIDKVGQPKGG